MSKVKIADSTSLQKGGRLIVQIGDLSVGVFRTSKGLRAYENVCAHQGGPACQGRIIPQVKNILDDGKRLVRQTFNEDDMHVVCPWHGAEYRIDTGEHVTLPKLALRRFDVEESDGHIYVRI